MKLIQRIIAHTLFTILFLQGCNSASNTRSFRLDNSCFSYFKTASDALPFNHATVTSLKWNPLPKIGPNFGYSSDTFFFRLSKDCLPLSLSGHTLEIEYPLEDIQVLVLNRDRTPKIVSLGEKNRVSQNLSRYRNHLLPLADLYRDDLFFRIKSETSIQFPVSLENFSTFSENTNETFIILGVFFGFLFFSFMSNAVNCIFRRNLTSLLYACFLGTYIVGQLSINRILQLYLFPNSYWFNLHSVPFTTTLAFSFFFLFSRSLLDTKSISRKIDYSYVAIAAMFLLSNLFTSTLPYRASISHAHTATVLFFVISVILTILTIFYAQTSSQKRLSIAFLIAWSPFLVGFIILILKSIGRLPNNVLTNYSPQFGTLIGILTFHFIIFNQQEELRLISMVQQVTHDVESPLSAIKNIEHEFSILPEKPRLVLNSSISRIKNILALLNSYSTTLPVSSRYIVNTSSIRTCHLKSLIEPLIEEKRAEYSARSNLNILFDVKGSTNDLFSDVDPELFGRNLSNIINNSAKYIEGAGTISVTLSSGKEHGFIEIDDTGSGIPDEVLGQIGKRPIPFGSQKGKGLGLFQASQTIQSWGGSFGARRKSNSKGSIVSIKLRKSHVQENFISSLATSPNEIVLCLDDDESIHHLLEHQLSAKCAKIIHLRSVSEFKAFASSNLEFQTVRYFLMDYRLCGEKETGLDLISKFGICSKSILVTNEFKNPDIVERCKMLGIKLWPKSLISTKPSESHSHTKRAALLDDDVLIIGTWTIKANQEGVNLIASSHEKEFLNSLFLLEKEDPIFIDFSLNGKRSGVDIAKHIRKLGFSNITLTTGYRREALRGIPKWLKVSGKDAPFGALA